MGRTTAEGNHPFRFILNHSQATVPNVYLLLYPKPILDHALQEDPALIQKIWEMLNQMHPRVLLGEGRVYGGGLHKLEPKELANVSADALTALISDVVQQSGQQLDLYDELTARPRLVSTQ